MFNLSQLIHSPLLPSSLFAIKVVSHESEVVDISPGYLDYIYQDIYRCIYICVCVCVCVCACVHVCIHINMMYVLSCFCHVQLFVTPWTVAFPVFFVHGILQARILEWVAMLSSREASRPRD